MNTLPEYMQNAQFDHRYAGNGFAVVEMLENEYCRVVGLGKTDIDKQVFTAWTKLLSVDAKEPIIPGHLKEKVDDLRAKLANKLFTIKNTRLVPCE